MSERGLFDSEDDDLLGDFEPITAGAPLAERMRPQDFDEIVGQDAVVGPGSLLHDLVSQDRVPSMILWGPPGTGKTTIAQVIARKTGLAFVSFSAVLSGVKEVRAIVAEAERRGRQEGRGTILFVDEIHRFNKGQQDAFLPHVEKGTIVLIGATTENPSFALNAALLSRCQLFTLQPHDRHGVRKLVDRALEEAARFGLPDDIVLGEEAREALVDRSGQDARSCLNALEALLLREKARGGLSSGEIKAADIEASLAKGKLRYDRSGEDHFNVMSAFHKSMRGGDPQASLYWMTRMLVSGEDPMWVARRIIRFASEDVGLADPQALPLAIAARETFRQLGSPEGELALAEAAVYMALAPKSNAVYKAYNEVRAELESGVAHEVPLYLRNAPTSMMKGLGYGRGYQYPHSMDEAVADQDYLPEELRGRTYYEPSPFGFEKELKKRMDWWHKVRGERKEASDER